jgi:hypothetical protein
MNVCSTVEVKELAISDCSECGEHIIETDQLDKKSHTQNYFIFKNDTSSTGIKQMLSEKIATHIGAWKILLRNTFHRIVHTPKIPPKYHVSCLEIGKAK